MNNRCEWAVGELLVKYHDDEWGIPIHNDRKIFEFLLLDGAQAGLSWKTILAKRENYRKAFDNFDAKKIAVYSTSKVELLLQDKGIVRNRKKIESFINNAKRFLEITEEFGTFDRYVWQFVKKTSKTKKYATWSDTPTKSPSSEKMSNDMKRRGFTFCGPTICYAFMQSIGMVDDHIETCFRKIK